MENNSTKRYCIMVAFFLIVVVVMSTSAVLAQDKIARQRCMAVCENHSMAYMGMSNGRCVCSPNLNVRFYYSIG